MVDHRRQRPGNEHQSSTGRQPDEHDQSQSASQDAGKGFIVIGQPSQGGKDRRGDRDPEHAQWKLIQALRETHRGQRAFFERVVYAEDGRADRGRIAGDQAVEEGVELKDPQAEDHRPGLAQYAAHRVTSGGEVARPPSAIAQCPHEPGNLKQPGEDHRASHGADVSGSILRAEQRQHADGSGDQANVQYDRRRSGRPEAPAHLKHRPENRHDTHHRHVRQHEHHQPNAEMLVLRVMGDEVEHSLTQQRDPAEHHQQQRDGQRGESLCSGGIVFLELRVGWQERRRQSTFAKEPAKQIGNDEREEEGVHDPGRAEYAAQRRIARKPGDPAGKGQQRKCSGVTFEMLGHVQQLIDPPD